jgi:hypothetical protein
VPHAGRVLEVLQTPVLARRRGESGPGAQALPSAYGICDPLPRVCVVPLLLLPVTDSWKPSVPSTYTPLPPLYDVARW